MQQAVAGSLGLRRVTESGMSKAETLMGSESQQMRRSRDAQFMRGDDMSKDIDAKENNIQTIFSLNMPEGCLQWKGVVEK